MTNIATAPKRAKKGPPPPLQAQPAHYEFICLKALADQRISYKAKALLSVLTRLESTSLQQLCDLAKDGRESVRCGLAELVRYGYLRHYPQRDTEGAFSDYTYEVLA